MADDKTTPEPAAKPTTIDDALAAYSAAEKAILKAVAVTEDLVHDEASGLRALFATTLATLRAGKPGGVSSL